MIETRRVDPVEAWRDYVEGVVRLKFWHVWDLHRDKHDRFSIQQNLDRRVDILRKTTLFDGRHPALGLDPPIHAWNDLKDELAALITLAGSAQVSDDLEDECWDLLRPSIEPALEEYRERLDKVKARPYKCWESEVIHDAPKRINLHFANAYQPRSPFSHCRDDLIDTLKRMLDDALREHQDVEVVVCSSWLNEFRPFQMLFPESWTKSFEPVYDYWPTYGWWGQYMTHEGRFHRDNGRRFREMRRHPLTAGEASCGVQELLDHLGLE
jgi:hypothetical protein